MKKFIFLCIPFVRKVEIYFCVSGMYFQEILLKYPSSDGTQVSRGDLGCTLSHLKVVQLAKERGVIL